MMDGRKCVKARRVAKGCQHPDLEVGTVGASDCDSFRSSHPLAISLGDIEKWEFRGIDIKGAFLRADGLGRDVSLRAPTEWGPSSD